MLMWLQEGFSEAHHISAANACVTQGSHIEVAYLDHTRAGQCHNIGYRLWREEILCCQSFHFRDNRGTDFDAGWVKVLDKEAILRLHTTSHNIGLTCIECSPLYIHNNLVQSQTLHFVDGGCPGKYQWKLPSTDFSCFVPANVEHC